MAINLEAMRAKLEASKNGGKKVPPLGKKGSDKRDGSHTRNTAELGKKTKEDNYINLS